MCEFLARSRSHTPEADVIVYTYLLQSLAHSNGGRYGPVHHNYNKLEGLGGGSQNDADYL